MKKIFYIALLAGLLFGCGVKKGVVSEKQGADTKVLAQRAETDELARQNTILPEKINSAWIKQFAGQYVLYLSDQQMPMDSISADSLVLTDNNFYYTYKQGVMVEYGRFNIRKSTSDARAFVMDWFSCYRDYHCCPVVYRHNTNAHKAELTITSPENHETKWIAR